MSEARAVDAVHRRCDEAIDRVRAIVTCPGKGCAACCRCDTVAHPAEVRALLPFVDAAAWERVAAKADLPPELALPSPCPLLDPVTRACTVYDHRPGLCRVYAVASPPAWCDAATSGVREIARPAAPVAALHDAIENYLPGGLEATTFLYLQLLRLRPAS